MLTQAKGARAEARVDFALPVDDVRGTAFIASTAVGEAAQESQALGGSFFTHHLETGLRGAADADGDGLVTLGRGLPLHLRRHRLGHHPHRDRRAAPHLRLQDVRPRRRGAGRPAARRGQGAWSPSIRAASTC